MACKYSSSRIDYCWDLLYCCWEKSIKKILPNIVLLLFFSTGKKEENHRGLCEGEYMMTQFSFWPFFSVCLISGCFIIIVMCPVTFSLFLFYWHLSLSVPPSTEHSVRYIRHMSIVTVRSSWSLIDVCQR